MDLGLRNKSVLVLASSKGLGKGIAKGFAQEGARVMIASRDEVALQKTTSELKEETGAEVNYYVCDLTDKEQIHNLVVETAKLYGTIDVLINNAGGPVAGDFDTLNDDDWESAFQLNLLSYVRAIREVLPYMRKQSQGHIINIASSSVKQPIKGLILSNTFRTGIVGLAKTLSQELASENILINTVGPGRIGTDRVEEIDRKRSADLNISYDEVRALSEKEIPLGRYGTPEEFSKLIIFLCSQANTYITGQVMLVDGGLTDAI